MSKADLKVGIAGVRGIAVGKHMPNLLKQPEVQITALCDVVDAHIDETLEKLKKAGVDGVNKLAKVPRYANYLEMLENEQLDVVHVCTPNISHAEISIAAMECGCHVMCEKPMSKTAEGARAMLAASKRTGQKLCIAYQNRYRPDSLYVKGMMKSGELGDVYFAKAHAIRRRATPTWGVFLDAEAQGGGPLIDIGTHALDLTLWLMDNYEVDFVVGTAYRKLADLPDQSNPWGDWDPAKHTVEDSAFGFIRMKNGATVFLESSWAINMRQFGEAITTLCGTKAGIDMWDGLHVVGDRHSRMYTEKIQLGAGGVAFYDGTGEDPNELEQKLWIDAILKDKPPFVDPAQALVVSEILEAIYASNANNGRPVYFENGEPDLQAMRVL